MQLKDAFHISTKKERKLTAAAAAHLSTFSRTAQNLRRFAAVQSKI